MKIKKILAGLMGMTLLMTGSMGGTGIGRVFAETAEAGGLIESYKCGTPEAYPVAILVLDESHWRLCL